MAAGDKCERSDVCPMYVAGLTAAIIDVRSGALLKIDDWVQQTSRHGDQEGWKPKTDSPRVRIHRATI